MYNEKKIYKVVQYENEKKPIHFICNNKKCTFSYIVSNHYIQVAYMCIKYRKLKIETSFI